MYDSDFRWGPLATGIYRAMLWLTVLIGWTYPQYVFHYAALLVFLGLGLKPLLIKTGLQQLLSDYAERGREYRWKGETTRRRAEIERKERDKKYKQSRIRDSRLPKNW